MPHDLTTRKLRGYDVAQLKWLPYFKNGWVYVGFMLVACTVVSSSFTDNFNESGSSAIIETGHMLNSMNPQWWLSSGGYVYRRGGIATTVQGKLADKDPFRLAYAKSSPVDTDNGYRPQNLLRLVTRAKFKNFIQEVFFKIDNVNISASPNRNQSNGILFFHRYQDADNLYYAGIRVDGCAIVKKKINGKYYLLKSVPVYQGSYNRDTEPNLLPVNRWIGIRTEIADKADGNTEIVLYLNDNKLGLGWTKVLQVEDAGSEAKNIMSTGFAGIRSDFMDVSFDNYVATENQN